MLPTPGGQSKARATGGRRVPPAARLLPVVVLTVALAGCGARAATGSASSAVSSGPTVIRSTTPVGNSSSALPGPGKTDLRFSRPMALARGAGLGSVSCGSSTFCVALDTEGRAYALDYVGWSAPFPPTGQALGPGALSVSCAGTTRCVAIATAASQVIVWSGLQWSAPTALPGATGLGAVGCAPSGYCAAVDAEGDAFAFDGQSWQGTSGDWGSVSSISCVSSTFCMSVSGGISRWDGRAWTKPASFGTTSLLTGVSCASAAFCTAVDQSGQALQWNGRAWSAPGAIEPGASASPGLTIEPTAVSCPTATYCAAVDSAGGVVQWTPTSLTRTVIDRGGSLTSVSCPTATFCMAVDEAGKVLVGRR